MIPKKNKQSLEDIKIFFWWGIGFGGSLIIFYVSNTNFLWKGVSTLGIMGAVGGSSFVLGFLIGFLFGVPRTVEPSISTSNKNSQNEKQQTVIQANTNLEQISDWLTKILVGVGLTQIIPILKFFKVKVVDNLAYGFDLNNIRNDAYYKPSPLAISITIAVITYFFISGFIIGYFYTVLVFSRNLKDNYDQLEEKIDNFSRSNNRIQLIRQIIDIVSPLTTEGILLKELYMSGSKKDADILSKVITNINKSLTYLRVDNDTIPLDFKSFLDGLIKNIDSDDYVLFRSTDYVNLAILLALKDNKEDYEHAKKFLDKAINTNQYSYDAYNLKGLIDNKLNNFDLAIESFARAIEIDRKCSKAWENKAASIVNKIKISFKDISQKKILELAKEVLECTNRAITLNPISVFAYVNQGYAFAKLGMEKEQMEAYEQAIKIDPKYSIPFFNKACVYAQRFARNEEIAEYQEAIKNLREAIELNQDLRGWAEKEDDFDSIRENKEFIELIK